jgi:NADPH-dependent curcumin reductase CurA
MALRSREIRLVRRPTGYPTPEETAFVETDVPEPREGEVVVRNALMSVDPYMRGRMNDVKSYVPAFRLDEPMEGHTVGTVVQSRSKDVPVGSTVRHMLGWRDYAVLPGKVVEVIDTTLAPAEAYLGILGTSGFTAWVGLFEIAYLKTGEAVFISAAAGAVGSAAGQLAKLHGAARVVGSTGSDSKAEYLRTTLGFDDAFTYNSGDVEAKLRVAVPEGIDVYFDNVGGVQLEAAIGVLKPFGRIAECGMISQYNKPASGPRNMPLIVGKRLRLQGFIVLDHLKSYPTFLAEAAPALREGRLTDVQTVVDGLENAPQALIDMLHGGGKHVGKVIVRIAQSEADA